MDKIFSNTPHFSRMKYVNFGKTGLKVSRLCLGTLSYGSPQWEEWILPEETSRPFIQKALELGINFFDTADMYSQGVSEQILGRSLKDFAKREQVVIATKVYYPMGDSPNDKGLSRKHIMNSIDASLRRLQTDYVDIYQIHRWDYETPIEETLAALHDIVKAGKARYIGASSMYAWQFAKALYLADMHGWTRFVSMQNLYNLIYREEEREMLPLCQTEGIAVIPWSPIARGFLAGNQPRHSPAKTIRARTDYQLDYEEFDFEIVDRVMNIAKQRGVSAAQISLAWLLHQPSVTAPIIGATKIEHLEEAVATLDLVMDNDERTLLEQPYKPRAIFGLD